MAASKLARRISMRVKSWRIVSYLVRRCFLFSFPIQKMPWWIALAVLKREEGLRMLSGKVGVDLLENSSVGEVADCRTR
jgi:hypothetical protein